MVVIEIIITEKENSKENLQVVVHAKENDMTNTEIEFAKKINDFLSAILSKLAGNEINE